MKLISYNVRGREGERRREGRKKEEAEEREEKKKRSNESEDKYIIIMVEKNERVIN